MASLSKQRVTMEFATRRNDASLLWLSRQNAALVSAASDSLRRFGLTRSVKSNKRALPQTKYATCGQIASDIQQILDYAALSRAVAGWADRTSETRTRASARRIG